MDENYFYEFDDMGMMETPDDTADTIISDTILSIEEFKEQEEIDYEETIHIELDLYINNLNILIKNALLTNLSLIRVPIQNTPYANETMNRLLQMLSDKGYTKASVVSIPNHNGTYRGYLEVKLK